MKWLLVVIVNLFYSLFSQSYVAAQELAVHETDVTLAVIGVERMDGIDYPFAGLDKHNKCISVDQKNKNGCMRGVLKNKCKVPVTVWFAAEKNNNKWEIDMVTLDVGLEHISIYACLETGRYVLLTSDSGSMGIRAPSKGQVYRIFNR